MQKKLFRFIRVRKYIDIKRNVLSPSTIAGYERMHRNYFKNEFGAKSLDGLTNTDIQIWIGDLSERLSPKTIRNVYGLLKASVEMFLPDFQFKNTLPAKKKPELYCPSDEDIKKLLNHIKGTELEIAVLLAAFGPLRRGETVSYTHLDVYKRQDTLSVQASAKAEYIERGFCTMDFDNIFLSTKEKILLFSLHFFKNHKRNLNSPHLKVLLDYELVTLNYLPSSGPDPVPIPDGTCLLYTSRCV